jgi:hypothetical protein
MTMNEITDDEGRRRDRPAARGAGASYLTAVGLGKRRSQRKNRGKARAAAGSTPHSSGGYGGLESDRGPKFSATPAPLTAQSVAHPGAEHKRRRTSSAAARRRHGRSDRPRGCRCRRRRSSTTGRVVADRLEPTGCPPRVCAHAREKRKASGTAAPGARLNLRRCAGAYRPRPGRVGAPPPDSRRGTLRTVSVKLRGAACS